MTESLTMNGPFAASLAERGKGQNQDFQASRTFGPDSDPIHLLVVADGVSSSPLAARASRVACESMIAESEQLVGLDPMELAARFEDLARHANTAVRDACQGKGFASLVAAIVQPQIKALIIVSVGDSGIYLSGPADFRILTRPDRAIRIRKEGGRVLIKDGVPIIDRGLSRALGANDAIKIKASRVEPWPQTPAWLCLASDGISWPHYQGFIEGLRKEGRCIDQGVLFSFVDEMRRYTEDDATALVLAISCPPGSVNIVTATLRGRLVVAG